jgi:dTDP-4-amino-4,6-dideoxygalactose transaminase
MKIPLLDLAAQHEPLKDELKAAFARILDSNRFILGEAVAAFEEELAGYVGVKFARGVGNCTDALTLAMRAVDIVPGDEIITTPFTFIASAETIANLGARPVFIDIDPETFNLDPAKIEPAITKKTRAIVPVHLYGQACAMDEILAIARAHKLKVIEDAAQSLGARYQGKMLGSFGDLACFSFYPSKNLSALGDGGAITTNDPDRAERIKMLRIHGAGKKYQHSFLGYNSRLDAVQAAFLSVKLKNLDRWNAGRRTNAEFYNSALAEIVETPLARVDCYHIYNQYTIRSGSRDKLQLHLQAANIGNEIHYPMPLHLQPAFRYLGYKPGDFPVAEQAAQRVISIPVYPELTGEEKNYIVRSIKEFKAS